MGIDVVAFVSHGKSSLVADCLLSYAKNFASHGHRPLILLVDSSASPSLRNEGRKALFDVSRRYGLDVRHFSQREYEFYSKRLDGEELGPGYRYATNGDWRIGSSEGAYFNRALLACSGKTTLFVNVDTLPELAGPRGGKPCFMARPSLGQDAWVPGRSEWGNTQLFKDGDELNRLVPRFHKEDVLSLFGSKLGRGFASCASEHSKSSGSVDGAVGVIQAGLWGVMQEPYSTSLLLSESFSPSLWAADDGAYLARKDTRLFRRVASHWSASRTSLVGRDCFSVSGDWPSSPFVPAGVATSNRGPVGLFSRDSITLEMPWAVRKVGSGVQTFSPGSAVDGAAGLSICDLFFVLLGMSAEGGSMVAAGEFLRGIGSASRDEFSSVLRTAARSWATTMRDRASEALGRCAAPSLRSDVQQVIDTYSQMLDNADYQMPREIRMGDYAFESERILRRQLVQYGELLSSWNLLVREAVALRENGIEMGAKP